MFNFPPLAQKGKSRVLHCLLLLYLYRFEVDFGIYCVQLAVKSMEGGSFGGLKGPTVHHYPVNVQGAACGTGQTISRV